jgi:CheY-like chemotaxis protein
MAQILLAEDDLYVRRTYQRFFTYNKYSCEAAPCNDECIEKAKKIKPDLILLDVMVKPEDSLKVLKKLKEDPETAKIPVVALIDSEENKYVNDVYKLGAKGHIARLEFQPEEIVKKVGEYLNN